jgi:fatty-acyl-CoA synthase
MNTVEWVWMQYATARMGVIMVALNPSYKHREIEYAINLSECKGVMYGNGYKEIKFDKVLEEIDVPGIEFKIKSEDVADLVQNGSRLDVDLERIENGLHADDPINIQFTSGTTGSPKAALLTHRNILNNGYFTGLNCKYTSNDKVCIPVPFYHCFGMVLGNLACTTTGAAMVIPGERFDAKQVLDIVEKEKCTSLYGVPTMMIGLLEYGVDKYDLSSLRTGVMAGSTCPITLMNDVIGKMNMRDVTIAYGIGLFNSRNDRDLTNFDSDITI